MGNSSKVNKLNDLTPKEWLPFTRTWFVHYSRKRKEEVKLHPAKFPEEMAEQFIRFFTKKGAAVLDPFLGTGSTLVACQNSGRKGIGIELQAKYVALARKRVDRSQRIIHGDAAETEKLDLPELDLVFTSPPYGPMLNKRYGEIIKDRRGRGLDVNYSSNKDDLGNSGSYQEFISRLVSIFLQIKPKIKDGGHLVVILQNYMHQKEYRPLAWDVGKELSRHFQFRGERIWCQDNKQLLPYGYRYCFIPNVHHHYCLVFRKTGGQDEINLKTLRML